MTERSYGTVAAAHAATPYPPQNLATLEAIARNLDLVEFTRRSGYIRADRRHGGPRLQLASGWVDGFISREEAEEAVDGLTSDFWETDRPGLWGCTLPVHGNANQGKASGRVEKTPETCPVHHVALPATGVCDDCD